MHSSYILCKLWRYCLHNCLSVRRVWSSLVRPIQSSELFLMLLCCSRSVYQRHKVNLICDVCGIHSPNFVKFCYYTYSTKPKDPLIRLKSVVSRVISFYARDSKLASYRRMFTSHRRSIFYNLCISISTNFLFFFFA